VDSIREGVNKLNADIVDQANDTIVADPDARSSRPSNFLVTNPRRASSNQILGTSAPEMDFFVSIEKENRYLGGHMQYL
jgi:hypothetical protein